MPELGGGGDIEAATISPLEAAIKGSLPAGWVRGWEPGKGIRGEDNLQRGRADLPRGTAMQGTPRNDCEKSKFQGRGRHWSWGHSRQGQPGQPGWPATVTASPAGRLRCGGCPRPGRCPGDPGRCPHTWSSHQGSGPHKDFHLHSHPGHPLRTSYSATVS